MEYFWRVYLTHHKRSEITQINALPLPQYNANISCYGKEQDSILTSPTSYVLAIHGILHTTGTVIFAGNFYIK